MRTYSTVKWNMYSADWNEHIITALFHLWVENKHVLMNPLFLLVLHIILIPAFLFSTSSLQPVLKYNDLIWGWAFKECLLGICYLFGLSQRWLLLDIAYLSEQALFKQAPENKDRLSEEPGWLCLGSWVAGKGPLKTITLDPWAVAALAS